MELLERLALFPRHLSEDLPLCSELADGRGEWIISGMGSEVEEELVPSLALNAVTVAMWAFMSVPRTIPTTRSRSTLRTWD